MLSLRKRSKIQLLLRRCLPFAEVAERAGVSLSTVKRIAREPEIQDFDDAAERRRRRIGRPSVTRRYERTIERYALEEPHLASAVIHQRLLLRGYGGGRSAIYVAVKRFRRAQRAALARPRAAGGRR